MPPKKGQKMSLAEFAQTLQTEDFGDAPAGHNNWADEEVELPTAPLGYGQQERPGHYAADSRPGRVPSRGYGRDEAPLPVAIDHSALPRAPPFMAFVANLSYDATEEDIRQFFSAVTIKNVRIPRSGESGSRGFAYAEFHSVEGLTEALLLSGKPLKGRACRVDLANQREDAGDSRIAAGNWREGHQVVEGRERMERPTTALRPSAPLMQSGNWRDTAKPVVAEISRPAESMKPAASKKPVLNLLPRSAPIDEEASRLATDEYKKSNKPNPFGNAKPREVILSEKGSQEPQE